MTVYVPSSPGIAGQATITPTPAYATGTSAQYTPPSLPGGYVVADGSGNNIELLQGIENAGNTSLGLQVNGPNPQMYIHTSGQPIRFITSAGYSFVMIGKLLGVGTANPTAGGGAGTQVQIMPADTPPSAGLAAGQGGLLYVTSTGALHWRGPTTDSQIAAP